MINNEKHQVFINIARQMASLSHCVSYKVGCVFVKDGRILSTGYNGTPAGYHNCDTIFPFYNKETNRELHREFSNMYEIHAEQNAIIFAAKEGISLKESSVYCTVEPCIHCTKMLIAIGVKNVYIDQLYDSNNEYRDKIRTFYEQNGVLVHVIKNKKLTSY